MPNGFDESGGCKGGGGGRVWIGVEIHREVGAKSADGGCGGQGAGGVVKVGAG